MNIRIFLKVLAAMSMVQPVVACAPNRTHRDLAKCVAQSTKNAPAEAQAMTEDAHDAIGEMVAECMKQGGYRHDQSSSKCVDDVDFNENCYVRI
jgi:hypothetical protein